jgi:hypothetical protein
MIASISIEGWAGANTVDRSGGMRNVSSAAVQDAVGQRCAFRTTRRVACEGNRAVCRLWFFCWPPGCTTTQTSATAPDTVKCQVTVSGTTASFNASGGTGIVGVSAERECPWTAAANASWIAINGSSSGQGNGSIAYSVAANQVPSPRSGALTVAATTVQLNQAAAPCLFSLSQPQGAVAATGGQISVNVSTLSGCSWTATATDPWIAVVAGQSGTASGTVTLSVAANTGGPRTGHALVAGQTFTVIQNSATAPPSPGQPPMPTQPTSVHLEGRVSALVGRCPNLQFVVNSTPVVTDASTDFRRKPTCDDMRLGVSVTVDGVRDNLVVRARTIEIRDNNEQ